MAVIRSNRLALLAAALALPLAAVLAAAMPGLAAAQIATPQVLPASACTVTPRTDAEIAKLAATPAVAPTPPAALPNGAEIDAATTRAIQATLDQLSACQNAGNVNAVLALYTDAYVSNVALAPERVPIVQGTPPPNAAASSATPPPLNLPAPVLAAARANADGSVTGLVLFGGSALLQVFRQEAGLWRIDGFGPFTSDMGSVAGSDLPAPVKAALTAASHDAATLLPADAALTVIHAEQRDWPDSSLGCPQPGKVYAQVITPGWLVIIAGPNVVFAYHTDAAGRAVQCYSPFQPG